MTNRTSGKFSPNEIHLLDFFGFGKLLDSVVHMNEPSYLDLCAMEAFIRNESNPETDAIRRGVKALHSGMFRKTNEFEKLIDLC